MYAFFSPPFETPLGYVRGVRSRTKLPALLEFTVEIHLPVAWRSAEAARDQPEMVEFH